MERGEYEAVFVGVWRAVVLESMLAAVAVAALMAAEQTQPDHGGRGRLALLQGTKG